MMKWFKVSGVATLAIVVVALGLMTRASPASANAGPHGNYTLTTSACGGCHRAHTAVGAYLLKAESAFALCTSCHGGLVSTDVVHGQFASTGAPLNGGGFEQAVVMSSYVTSGGTPTSGNVSSSHTVEDLPVSGTPASGVGTAWGGKSSGVGAGPGTLECTSCHNPHGSTNYRILSDRGTGSTPNAKWIAGNSDLLDWVNYQVQATRDDGPTYTFDLNPANCPPSMPGVTGGIPTPQSTQLVATVTWPAGIGGKCMARYTSGVFSPGSGATAVPNVLLGMNAFCATCHKSYLTMSGSAQNFNSLNAEVPGLATVGPGTPTRTPPYIYPGTQDALDGHGDVARYRHAVDFRKGSGPKQPLRFAALGNDPNPASGGTPVALAYTAMGCLTCHFAHGSAAAQTPAAANGLFLATSTPGPGGTPPAGPIGPDGPAGDSSLLFYSNRGVCISCHQTVGTLAAVTVTPTATATPLPPTATPTSTPGP